MSLSEAVLIGHNDNEPDVMLSKDPGSGPDSKLAECEEAQTDLRRPAVAGIADTELNQSDGLTARPSLL